MKEIENVIKILKETLESINSGNIGLLRNLSDQTIHTASISQDEENISIAVMIYALEKIYQRQDYKRLEGWKNFERIIHSSIKTLIKDLEERDQKKFERDFQIMKKTINKISGKLKIYIEQVFNKAKIHKASRIHEHGISLEKTSKLLGVSMFELANYTGETGISEVATNQTMTAKDRIKMLEKFFQ